MELTKSGAKVAGWVLVIPAISLTVALMVLAYMLEGVPASADIAGACRNNANDAELQSFCGDYGMLMLLRNGAIAAAALPMGLLVLQVIGAMIAGRSRPRMAAIFPALTLITILGLVVTVIVQACVFMGAIYFGEAAAIHRVHTGVIGGIGLAAAFAAWTLSQSTLSMMRAPELSASGDLVDRRTAPRLFAHVEALAKRLGAKPPKQIVLGVEPTFYVTSARVKLFGVPQALQGETLYLSLPLARLLTPGELTAVVGHELGHFRGGDTEYSLKFAPVYRGLGDAINMLDAQNADRPALTSLPVQAMLRFLYTVFAHNESAVGRQRELEADKAGAEGASGREVATSLLKCGLYGQLWPGIDQQAAALANTGVHVRNFTQHLTDAVRLDIEQGKSAQIIDDMMGYETRHPVDTHPPIGERLAALGVSRESLADLDLTKLPDISASTLIDDVERHELVATEAYQKQGVALRIHGDGGTHVLAVNRALAGHQVVAAVLRSAGPLTDETMRQADDACLAYMGDRYFPLIVREMLAADVGDDTLDPAIDAAIQGTERDKREAYSAFLAQLSDIVGGGMDVLARFGAARLRLADAPEPAAPETELA